MAHHGRTKSPLPPLAAMWTRLAVLTRHPSSATDEEKAALASMAAHAQLLAVGEPLNDHITAAVMSMHMPLWEAMVEAGATLPWLADGTKGLPPSVESIAIALRTRGHSLPLRLGALSFTEKIASLVRAVATASARSAASCPFASSMRALDLDDASLGRRNERACLLAILDIGIRYAFLAFMPFVDPFGLTTLAIYSAAPPTTGGSDIVYRGELLQAAVAQSGPHFICADPVRAGAALSPNRFRALFGILADA
ncbi:hypothetical protein TW95_gp0780 [Pandoravirus inopinatum]|uniref:Uncharacterized protein n=1 Tax=Pandoravirus inopinatum TaxID=1605721 RepID=A0A0B5J1U0_9VIRU|nr:hypothetical protein TW95_gp0780 [Pandoravirus inopinatum]AJF97514.1 hypothetical protein [Pandoravirus inopinatum]